LLRASVSNVIAWPLRLSLKSPSAVDLSSHFESVRDWIRTLANTPHVRIEWRDWNHRVQGTQRIPAAVWVDTLQDALEIIGKVREVQRFEVMWRKTASTQPLLLPWMSGCALQALSLADRWGRFLDVVAWLQAHPRPNVYMRQVDVAGVDSKFIETNRGVLSELLDLGLSAQAIESDAVGVGLFTRRFGFRDKPVRIRFRYLDAALPSLPGCAGMPDVTLDAASFAALTLPVEHVFISENEANFLAFPSISRAIVIFGAGYGWEALARAAWMDAIQLHYWGDIDTHGFAILDQLRCHFPHAASFLMDRETLLAHRSYWGEEPEPVRHDLPRLSAEEAAVYDELRFDRLQPRLRLEQERIGYGWLSDRLLGASSLAVRYQ
jgi:hypothetical protein